MTPVDVLEYCERLRVIREWIGTELATSYGSLATDFVAGNISSAADSVRDSLVRHLSVPPSLLTEVCKEANGFFACEDICTDSGEMQGHNTWFRCLVKVAGQDIGSGKGYVWHEMSFFTRWLSGRSTILCMDTPASLRTRLEASLSRAQASLDFSDPYSMHVPLVDGIIALYDQSIWAARDLIRGIEKRRTSVANAEPNFSTLHETARHAIHSSETLTVAIETVTGMQRQQLELSASGAPTGAAAKAACSRRQKYMQFQVQMLRSLKSRSQANQERLNNEITLAYNIIAQRDSRVMVRMAEAARSDSASMKTVAVVTMTFLPATFISAIFSMSFFNFTPAAGEQPERWSVSGQMWVYWAFAIPLTLLTTATWFTWQRLRGR